MTLFRSELYWSCHTWAMFPSPVQLSIMDANGILALLDLRMESQNDVISLFIKDILIRTSSQQQFKPDIPQGGVLSPTIFNIPPARAPVQVMAYAVDITITSTHTARWQPRNTYNHTYIQFLSGQYKTISQ